MGVMALEEVSAPVLPRIFHYIIILFPIYTLMHVQSNNASISKFIPYLNASGAQRRYHKAVIDHTPTSRWLSRVMSPSTGCSRVIYNHILCTPKPALQPEFQRLYPCVFLYPCAI
jgi:hypothetical protein